jgi:hypothetical protein
MFELISIFLILCEKGDWTKEEDRIILSMQKSIGNQWAKVDDSLKLFNIV